MNREFLKGLGLDDEAVEKVMVEHGKTVNTTKNDLATVTTERDDLKTQIADRDTQLVDLGKKAKDSEELTAEINRLKQENADNETEYQGKIQQQLFDTKLADALRGAKARNPKAIKALLDTDKIKLDGETILGLDDQLTALKTSDAYLFDTETPALGGRTPHTPSGQAPTGTTKEQFDKMNYTERVKLHTENPELYTKLNS